MSLFTLNRFYTILWSFYCCFEQVNKGCFYTSVILQNPTLNICMVPDEQQHIDCMSEEGTKMHWKQMKKNHYEKSELKLFLPLKSFDI